MTCQMIGNWEGVYKIVTMRQMEREGIKNRLEKNHHIIFELPLTRI